jgi:hypothetical protein
MDQIKNKKNKFIKILMIAGVAIAVGSGVFFVFQKFYFTRSVQPASQFQIGKCGDGICDQKESSDPDLCLKDCAPADLIPSPISEPITHQFLWGTEVYPDRIDMTQSIITDILRIKNLKIRFAIGFFSKDGKNFSNNVCLPSQNNCLVSYDMDDVVKKFKKNGWSMMPMFSYKTGSYTITKSSIDDYVNFVDWFVSRYRTDANMKYIELINAPNCVNGCFWAGTNAQLLDANNKVYDRIKSKYPGILVGTPGFEYWADAPSTDQNVQTMEYFLDKNNGAKFDFWAFHAYPTIELAGGKLGRMYPPTKSAEQNKYAGIKGILEVRKKLDENGWQNRLIIDTEQTCISSANPVLSETEEMKKLDAAYTTQDLLLKRALVYNGKSVLSGINSLKLFPAGRMGESFYGSLNSDGSATPAVSATGLFLDKMNSYAYSKHISGEFDIENTPWIEKFSADKKELYIFFKPFKHGEGKNSSFDNEIIDYALTLEKQPKLVILTDIYGNKKNIAPARILTLEAENSPKYLEVGY